MSTTARSPYIWVTWITGLLAADDHCHWQPWFKAHFKYAKVAKDDGFLKQWKVKHGAMVEARALALRAEGYTVAVEDQNKITLAGRTGIVVAGTPDLVATKDTELLIVDCKSGQRRDKDYWQVCIYMFLLPTAQPNLCAGRQVRGEVQYLDGSITISPEQMTAGRERIVAQIHESGSVPPPSALPSRRECGFCDISAVDCQVRFNSEHDNGTATSADF